MRRVPDAARRWALARPRAALVVIAVLGTLTVVDAAVRIGSLLTGRSDLPVAGLGLAAGLLGAAWWRRRAPATALPGLALFVAGFAALPRPGSLPWLPETLQLAANCVLLAFLLGAVPVVGERMRLARRDGAVDPGFAARAAEAVLGSRG